MRLIPDNCPTLTVDTGLIYGTQFSGAPMTFYGEPDTIEITDKKLDIIAAGWLDMIDPDDMVGVHFPEQLFSKYLRDLIQLSGESK
jgi:hypothetical protein